MREFLRFVVETSLSGQDSPKETIIGVEVFGRAPGYDPGLEPIVRVEARRLRDKLEQYYAREDADDAVAIKLPKGGYTPEFEIRLAPQMEEACEGDATRYCGTDPLVRAERPRPASHRLLYALGVAAVLSGLIVATQTKPTIAANSQSRLRIAPEAQEAYLKGRYFWNKRTESGLLKSLEYFREAVAKSPKYARAWDGLADGYLLLGEFRLRPREQAFGNAQNAIDKALALDNNLGEAHATLAALEADNNQWGLAEPEFRRALRLSPGYATAHQWYAEELVAHGRISEALTEIRRANKLDPLSLTVSVQVGYILFMSRRYDEAIAQLQSAIDMDPYFALAHAVLGHAYEQKGMYSKAIAELQKSADLSQDPVQTLWLAHARALAGQKAEAHRVRAALEESGHAPALPMALLDLALGERDRALVRLEGACSRGPMGALSPTPLYDPLRADPQIAALLARCASSSTRPLLAVNATSAQNPGWK